jgi:hypothetical protein
MPRLRIRRRLAEPPIEIPRHGSSIKQWQEAVEWFEEEHRKGVVRVNAPFWQEQLPLTRVRLRETDTAGWNVAAARCSRGPVMPVPVPVIPNGARHSARRGSRFH